MSSINQSKSTKPVKLVRLILIENGIKVDNIILTESESTSYKESSRGAFKLYTDKYLDIAVDKVIFDKFKKSVDTNETEGNS
jgi:hypothetical protein